MISFAFPPPICAWSGKAYNTVTCLRLFIAESNKKINSVETVTICNIWTVCYICSWSVNFARFAKLRQEMTVFDNSAICCVVLVPPSASSRGVSASKMSWGNKCARLWISWFCRSFVSWSCRSSSVLSTRYWSWYAGPTRGGCKTGLLERTRPLNLFMMSTKRGFVFGKLKSQWNLKAGRPLFQAI